MTTTYKEAQAMFNAFVEAAGRSNAEHIISAWKRKRLQIGDAARPERDDISPAERARMYKRQNGVCGICRKPMEYALLKERTPGKRLEVDHINPHLSGEDYTAKRNLQLAHGKCNREKAAQTLNEQSKHYSRTVADILTGAVDPEHSEHDEEEES